MMMDRKKSIISFSLATLLGVVVGVVVLLAINNAFLRLPDVPAPAQGRLAQPAGTQPPAVGERDYKPLLERNLFRAKLQVEIPKPKSEQEIEEEMLTAAVKTMALKGIMIGQRKKDTYAVIDVGGQKGVWTFEAGEIVDKGLTLKEIRKDSVKLEKGAFGAVLKLFSPVYERTQGSLTASAVNRPQPGKEMSARPAAFDLNKEVSGIHKEGSVTVIPKSLVEKMKVDNNIVMSSVAVKMADDGLKVVAVDKGSIAQKIGISPNDTLQDINGHRLNSSEDLNKVYEALKNSTSFEVRLMRRGKPETLRYQIR